MGNRWRWSHCNVQLKRLLRRRLQESSSCSMNVDVCAGAGREATSEALRALEQLALTSPALFDALSEIDERPANPGSSQERLSEGVRTWPFLRPA